MQGQSLLLELPSCGKTSHQRPQARCAVCNGHTGFFTLRNHYPLYGPVGKQQHWLVNEKSLRGLASENMPTPCFVLTVVQSPNHDFPDA